MQNTFKLTNKKKECPGHRLLLLPAPRYPRRVFLAPEYFLEHFLGSCELAGHVATGRATCRLGALACANQDFLEITHNFLEISCNK